MARMSVRVEVAGNAVADLQAKADELVEDLANQVVKKARTIVPIDTGRLRSTIHAERAVENSKVRVYVGSDLNYARFVEEGTSRMAAQPYLRPALYQARVGGTA